MFTISGKKPGKSIPQDKISFVQLFEPWGWIIGSGIYIDDVEEAYQKDLVASLLVIVPISLALLIAVLIISKSLLTQLSDFHGVMSEICRSNDLTRRADTTAKNELGEMAREFNKMLESFEGSVQIVLNSVDQLATAAEQMSVVAQQTSNGVRRQSQEIDMVASAMEEMSVSVGEVSTNTTRTAEETSSGASQTSNASGELERLAEELRAIAHRFKVG